MPEPTTAQTILLHRTLLDIVSNTLDRMGSNDEYGRYTANNSTADELADAIADTVTERVLRDYTRKETARARR